MYAFGIILLELVSNKPVRSLWRKDQKSYPLKDADINYDPSGSVRMSFHAMRRTDMLCSLEKEEKNTFIAAVVASNYRPEFPSGWLNMVPPSPESNTEIPALFLTPV